MASIDGRSYLGIPLEGSQKIHHVMEPALGERSLNRDPERWVLASRGLLRIEPGQQSKKRPDVFEQRVYAHMEVVYVVHGRKFPEVEVLRLCREGVARLAGLV